MQPSNSAQRAAACLLFALSAHAQSNTSLQAVEPGSASAPLQASEPCWIGTGCVPQSDLDYNQRVADGDIPLVIQNGVQPQEPSAVWGGTTSGPSTGTNVPSSAGAESAANSNASGEASQLDLARIAAQYAGQELTGDVGLACEAMLCLAAAGSAPSECARSLNRYYSIVFKSWRKTAAARRAFLALCPVSNEGDMPSFVDAITNGAGVCDVNSLNRPTSAGGGEASDSVAYISNTLPSNCASFYSQTFIGAQKPMYVGTPERGGHWVAADEYSAVLDRYNARIRAEDEAAQHINRGDAP